MTTTVDQLSETEYILTEKQLLILRQWRHLHAHSDQTNRYIRINQITRTLAKVFMQLCPDSRDLDRALDNLEDARHWATRSISKNELPDDNK
jgi:hypothetical protein